MKLYKICNKISLPLQAIWCAFLYFLIEAISRHSLFKAWDYMTGSPLVFAYNTGFLFVSMLPVYLFRHRVFFRVLISVFWLLLGIINGVLLMSRVTPFTGPDLKLLTDAAKIVDKYLTPTSAVIAAILLVVTAIVLFYTFIKAPKYHGKRQFRYILPLILGGVAAFAGITQIALEKRILSNYFGNIAFAYEDYGYPYCLFTTLFHTGISQPRDYSEEEIQRIENTEKDLPKTVEDGYPNVIFLQLESFFDPMLVNYLEISEDPIPNFRALMQKYSSGYFKVPSIGAGTANTEFETITGMSMHYFGPGEYPYKSILTQTTCESAPYVLKELGYTTHAIHNNEANFYGRKTIFPNLGFDTFTSAEYMPEEDDTNVQGWTRDRVLTDEILKCLDVSEGPDYVYAISVQGHGSYPEEPILDDAEILVSGSPTKEMDYQWEYYVNQLREMDCFIGELVEALEAYPEDVVLVLFGDHLPTMDLKIENLKNRYLFQTQYVIYDNFGLKKQNANLAAYQMAATVMDRIGIHEGTVFRYHQARRNTKNYQVDLEMLQYDILYGSKFVYGGENPYERTKMRLGLYDTTLDSMQLISNVDNTYYIRGTNFTPSSEVKLNGEWYDTVYVNPTTLVISGQELKDFDELAVVQRSNSSTRRALSKSRSRLVYALLDGNKWNLPTNFEE